jgi:hypothetical protein
MTRAGCRALAVLAGLLLFAPPLGAQEPATTMCRDGLTVPGPGRQNCDAHGGVDSAATRALQRTRPTIRHGAGAATSAKADTVTAPATRGAAREGPLDRPAGTDTSGEARPRAPEPIFPDTTAAARPDSSAHAWP